jgi:hypothetical protein
MSCSPDGMLQNGVCSAVEPSLLAMVHHMTDVSAAHKCAALPVQENMEFDNAPHAVKLSVKICFKFHRTNDL